MRMRDVAGQRHWLLLAGWLLAASGCAGGPSDERRHSHSQSRSRRELLAAVAEATIEARS